MKPIGQIIEPDGSVTATPSAALSKSSKPASPQTVAAKAAAASLFRLLPPLVVVDPQAFITQAVVTFAKYPAQVWPAAVSLIVSRTDRPTIKDITEACDEVYAPIARQLRRERAAGEHLLLPPPRVHRTKEEQARIDAHVAEFRQMFPRASMRRSFGHGARVQAELDARRALREEEKNGIIHAAGAAGVHDGRDL